MKILLIDHHELFRDGLRYVLQKLPSGVGELLEAGDFSSGLKCADQHPDLDLVLLELNSCGCKGADSVKLFCERYPHLPLVVVSGDEDFHVINHSLSYGASAFVCKSSPETMFLEALESVLAGKINVSPQIFQSLAKPNEYRLTRRQIEILRCLTEGFSNKEIAEKFDLAEGTVKVHVSALFHALGVRSRKEAARVAGLRGLC